MANISAVSVAVKVGAQHNDLLRFLADLDALLFRCSMALESGERETGLDALDRIEAFRSNLSVNLTAEIS